MTLGLALFALLQGATAAPQTETVFGIDLGKPPSAPQCQRDRWGIPEAPADGMCWTLSEKVEDTAVGRVQSAHYRFAEDAQPQIAINVDAQLIDGNVERVEFQTLGAMAIPVVMDALRAKYGKPISEEKVPVQNRMGATFDGVEATWMRGKLSVVYHGITHQVDRGAVTINTSLGHTLYLLEVEQERKKGTSL
ncbi:hypothetical protein [Pseudoxanthomonas sp.]|uniref:hypothetical protein n=1 Tax=Pseudoxanthomonas sp. TaxID=1871049 RepID=UPI0025E37AF7|nr:hypothetical protein [Pseudoxanthomonas sp.]